MSRSLGPRGNARRCRLKRKDIGTKEGMGLCMYQGREIGGKRLEMGQVGRMGDMMIVENVDTMNVQRTSTTDTTSGTMIDEESTAIRGYTMMLVIEVDDTTVENTTGIAIQGNTSREHDMVMGIEKAARRDTDAIPGETNTTIVNTTADPIIGNPLPLRGEEINHASMDGNTKSLDLLNGDILTLVHLERHELEHVLLRRKMARYPIQHPKVVLILHRCLHPLHLELG